MRCHAGDEILKSTYQSRVPYHLAGAWHRPEPSRAQRLGATKDQAASVRQGGKSSLDENK